jgi:hypothetical protein
MKTVNAFLVRRPALWSSLALVIALLVAAEEKAAPAIRPCRRGTSGPGRKFGALLSHGDGASCDPAGRR